jgi:hypothetical protein
MILEFLDPRDLASSLFMRENARSPTEKRGQHDKMGNPLGHLWPVLRPAKKSLTILALFGDVCLNTKDRDVKFSVLEPRGSSRPVQQNLEPKLPKETKGKNRTGLRRRPSP